MRFREASLLRIIAHLSSHAHKLIKYFFEDRACSECFFWFLYLKEDMSEDGLSAMLLAEGPAEAFLFNLVEVVQ